MKKNKLNKGDIIINGDLKATVIDPNWKEVCVKVKIKNAQFLLTEHMLNNWKFSNPIINNRIISDKTFAIRLKNFIEDTVVNDACSLDDKGYLLNVANRLLNYQIDTAADEGEIEYLKGLELL
jgi:hypothetical protein